MAAKAFIPNPAKLALLQGIHQQGDVYKIALYSSVIGLNEGTDVYVTANEAMGVNYEAGGRVLDGYQVTTDQDAAILDFDDPVWLNSTISARGALIYNASKGNRSLCVLDFDALFTSSNGAFRLQLPPPTKATGLIKIR